MADQTPGEILRSHKERLAKEMAMAVRGFEGIAGVQVQSAHCYTPAPDPTLLNDAPKLKVDIVLNL